MVIKLQWPPYLMQRVRQLGGDFTFMHLNALNFMQRSPLCIRSLHVKQTGVGNTVLFDI